MDLSDAAKKPLGNADLAAFGKDLGLEALLVQSAREMAAGNTHNVYAPVVVAPSTAPPKNPMASKSPAARPIANPGPPPIPSPAQAFG